MVTTWFVRGGVGSRERFLRGRRHGLGWASPEKKKGSTTKGRKCCMGIGKARKEVCSIPYRRVVCLERCAGTDDVQRVVEVVVEGGTDLCGGGNQRPLTVK
jgi:hypothetical protein